MNFLYCLNFSGSKFSTVQSARKHIEARKNEYEKGRRNLKNQRFSFLSDPTRKIFEKNTNAENKKIDLEACFLCFWTSTSSFNFFSNFFLKSITWFFFDTNYIVWEHL